MSTTAPPRNARPRPMSARARACVRARGWLHTARAAWQSYVAVPPGPVVRYLPRPSDRRTTAELLEVGDTVFVWAHDTPHLSTGCTHELWRFGTVTRVVDTKYDLRPLAIGLDGREPVHAQRHAIAYVVAAGVIERPDPADEPQPAPPPAEKRTRSIKVAAIRPGMEVTVEVTAQAHTGPAGSSIVQVPQHTDRGVVIATSVRGDLAMLRLRDVGEEPNNEGRRVYTNARHGALLHVDVDEPYDQTQEV